MTVCLVPPPLHSSFNFCICVLDSLRLFLVDFATSCSRKQSLFFYLWCFCLVQWFVLFWFGLVLFFFPSTPHRDESSMQFDKGSWNLTLLLSISPDLAALSLASQFLVTIIKLNRKSFNISNMYFIRVSDFHPHGFYCASVSLLSKAIILHIILHGCCHFLTCTSYSVIPINLVAW